jgi:hypothetical protein
VNIFGALVRMLPGGGTDVLAGAMFWILLPVFLLAACGLVFLGVREGQLPQLIGVVVLVVGGLAAVWVGQPSP